MSRKDQLVVMYSGGTDSTYAVWSQIPHFRKFRLITFVRQGFRKKGNTLLMVERLKKGFPETEFTWETIDFEGIYQQVTPRNEKEKSQMAVLKQEIGPIWETGYRQDIDSDKITLFMANECLQCKIAMHLAAIQYCLDSGISDLCDGSNLEQLDDGSQLEDVKNLARDIFGQFGLNYFSPAYTIPVDERCRELHRAGIIDDQNHKQLEKNHQIPSSQIQCTVPGAVLWTAAIFPWLVFDGPSCDGYVNMCYNYYMHEMKRNIDLLGLQNRIKKEAMPDK